MKKLLSLLLAFAISLIPLSSTVSAEDEDLNEIFVAATRRGQFVYMGEIAPGERFSATTMFELTNLYSSYEDEYGSEEGVYEWTDEDGVVHKEYYLYDYPAELFEEKVGKYFVLDEEYITALHSLEQYNSETDTYRTSMTGLGDSTTYIPYGYLENEDGTYTFYGFFIDLADADIGYIPAEGDKLYEDYTIYNGSYYEIYSKVKATFDYDGEYARFLSFEENNIQLPDVDTIVRPAGTIVDKYLYDSGINVFSYDSVFPNNTILNIIPLNDETNIAEIEAALPNTTVISAFDISATNNNETIQPDGTICISFYLPDDYDPENQSISLYYIDENGNTEKINGIYIKTPYSLYMNFKVTHFSRYAIALTEEAFEDTSLVMDENYYAYNIKAGETAGDYPALKFIKGDNVLENNKLIGTGTEVFIDNYSSFTAVVMGETSGDGKINSTDFMQVRKQYLSLYEMNEAQSLAADVNGDGKINSTDFMQIRKHFLGLYNLYA